MLKQLLMIALGGALGALGRYGLANVSHAVLGRNFAYGTLIVNVLGSLLIGFAAILLLERVTGSAIRGFILIGFLGAFTTFSTFSYETLSFLEQGEILKSLLNVFTNVGFCLIATWIGIMIARQL